METEELLKLRKMLTELGAIRGRHTELVSVYVPSGHNLIETINQINQEKSTASNIKSKATRKNVLDALEKIVQHLRLFKQTPPNGLIVFCGNVSPVEGKTDLKLWSFEPPEKMNVKLYWCDQVFVLDPMRELIKEKEVYGLIVLDANEANIGLLKGKRVVQLKHMDSTVPAKSIKGGMCLHEDTVVSNGKNGSIKHVKEGDKIMSFDFSKKKFVFSKVDGVMKRKADLVYRITTDAGHEILTTPEHLFFVKKIFSTAEVPAEKLEVGDRLMSVDFEQEDRTRTVKITRKGTAIPHGFFFDLSVPGVKNFVANGLIVHNSQMRYDRLRDDALNEFFRKVADVAANVLLELDLKGVLVGGPGPTKDTFFKNEYLNYQIQKKVLGVKDIGYTGMEGLEELVKRSEDLIKESKYAKEREILRKFFVELQKGGNVTYGHENVSKALNLGAVETIILSEDFSMSRTKFKCPQCGATKQMDITPDKRKQLCDNCHGLMTVDEELDLSEIVLRDAAQYGSKVEWVSSDTEEGRQFRNIGAIGALLRYKLST